MQTKEILEKVCIALGHVVTADHSLDELKRLREEEWGPEFLEFVRDTIQNLALATAELAPLITE